MMELKLNFTWISAVVKTIATGFCVFFFIRNAEYNYKMYDKGNTINTINMREQEQHWTGPPMPWIVFCLKTPFKDSSKILLTPDDFISNTFDPQEYVGNITYFLSSASTGQQIETPRKTIYTTHNGRCLVLMFNTTFTTPNQYVNIELKEADRVFAHVLRPGEDTYLLYMMFPYENPDKLMFSEANGYYDIFLAYEDLIDEAGAKDDLCIKDEKEWENTQANCIRKNAQRLVRRDNCTLPWTWSLLDLEYSRENFIKCNERQFVRHRDFPVWKYLNDVPPEDCKRQCHRRIVTTKVKQVTSNAHPCLSGGNDPETCARKQKDTRINKTDVGFWFRDVKKVKTVSTIFRLDWATLTANIGGTMGLYLGWGLLDFIMKVYEYLIKLICFISKRFLNTPLDISP